MEWGAIAPNGLVSRRYGSTVYLSSMSNFDDRHHQHAIDNLVDDTVIPNADAPGLGVGQLHTTWRTWILGQGQNGCVDTFQNWAGKIPQRLTRCRLHINSVGH